MGRAGDPERLVAGVHPVCELLRAGAGVRTVLLATSRERRDEVDEIRRLAAAAGVPVVDAPRDEIDRAAGGLVHQGVVAIADPYAYADLDDLVRGAAPEPPLLVALDGVTDPQNLGSIARTAEAIGAHGLVVPGRRSAGVTAAAEKAAAGALAHLPVAQVTNLARAIGTLGEEGVWAVGLDAGGETDVRDCELFTEPVVIVVGAEGRGLSRLVAERCDVLVRLPMRGRVASLNASVAAALALYEARRRRDAGQDQPPRGAPAERTGRTG